MTVSISSLPASVVAHLNNSTAGCTSTAQIPSDYGSGPIYHDPSSGICYPLGVNGYNPKLATGIVFVVLFSLLTILHLGLLVKSKRWWLSIIVIGSATEVGGWIGRALSGTDNTASSAAKSYFLVQIVMITIAPVFFSGTCYGILVVLVNKLDSSVSRFTPKRLTQIFVVCDIISLLLQAAGGALTSGAKTYVDQNKYTHVFVAGIAFQLLDMILFSILAVDYFWRLRIVRHTEGRSLFDGDKGAFWAAAGMAGASLTIIIRGIYRTIELAQGWSGYLITHESYFLGLDGAMMLLCVLILAITHPAFTLPKMGSVSGSTGSSRVNVVEKSSCDSSV